MRCNINFYFLFQDKLKRNQRDKAREFLNLTQTGEKTAIYTLTHHDWKLEQALDAYFANPEHYYKEPRQVAVDKKKLEQAYNRFRGRTQHKFHYPCLALQLQTNWFINLI